MCKTLHVAVSSVWVGAARGSKDTVASKRGETFYTEWTKTIFLYHQTMSAKASIKEAGVFK